MALSLEDARRAYAEEIRAVADIQCDRLIEAFARVPREAFLGPGPWLIGTGSRTRRFKMPAPDEPTPWEADYRATPDADPRHLYHNVLIGIDPKRSLNNGQPTALAAWFDTLEPRLGDRMLHVGCGVGYYTAVIAEAVGPSGSVLAVEYDAGLAERARANLAAWPNVRVVEGDGATIDAGEFDIGFINAGATRLMPSWLAGLQPGGRLLVPLTVQGQGPVFGGGCTLLIRRGGERWEARFTGMVEIFPCHGARDEASHAELLKLYRRRGMHSVQSLRRDQHELDPTCAVHLDDYCLSTLPPG